MRGGLLESDDGSDLVRTAAVVSEAFGRAANFLDYGHPDLSSPLQMSTLRTSYRDSGGTTVLVPAHRFADARVEYAGAWSRVRAPQDAVKAAEFTTGALRGLVGDAPEQEPDPRTFTEQRPYRDGCAVVAASGYNLYHFLWEHLPSIYLYRDLVSEAGRLLLGVIDSPNAFAGRLVQLLGIDVDIVPMPLHSSVPILGTTVLGTFPFRVYPVDVMREVSRLVTRGPRSPLPQGTGPSVVFLGRGDRERNRRPLTNEPAVLAELERWRDGYALLRPALTPIDETIAGVRDCRVLVGPTGGAMAHHLWARDLEHVVEIVPTEYPGATETELASAMLGFTYHRVDAARETDGRRWADAGSACDIAALSRVLRTIGPAAD